MSPTINSEQFLKKLKSYRSPAELKKIQRYFKSGEGEYSHGDEFIGVRMGQVFALAKEFIEMYFIRQIEASHRRHSKMAKPAIIVHS
jgi:hypothetical protein